MSRSVPYFGSNILTTINASPIGLAWRPVCAAKERFLVIDGAATAP